MPCHRNEGQDLGPGRYRTDAAHEWLRPRYTQEGATWSLKPRFGGRGIAVLPMGPESDSDDEGGHDGRTGSMRSMTQHGHASVSGGSAATAPVRPSTALGNTSSPQRPGAKSAMGLRSPRAVVQGGTRRRRPRVKGRDFMGENKWRVWQTATPVDRAANIFHRKTTASQRAEAAKAKRDAANREREQRVQAIVRKHEVRVVAPCRRGATPPRLL